MSIKVDQHLEPLIKQRNLLGCISTSLLLGTVMPQIIADLRESRFVIKALRKMKAKVVKKMISPGDYVVGEGFAVERKTFQDLVQSVYKKRLFEQIERLHQAYPRCCLIVEGDIGYGLATLYNPLIFLGGAGKSNRRVVHPHNFHHK